MNFHSDEWIKEKLQEHYDEAKTIIPEEQIVGIFLQGSQNYGLDIEGSDVDTKLIVTPSLEDLVFNRPPISTTHIRENEEHIDIKDIRVYFETFEKQNLNFLEILFTPYMIINPKYTDYIQELLDNRELIARMNPVKAVKSMVGVAGNKLAALQHPYPSKLEVLAKYGYDPKQLHHLFRVEEYLKRFIDGEPYESCLIPHDGDYLVKVKQGLYPVEEAVKLANESFKRTKQMEVDYCEGKEIVADKKAEDILKDIQYRIMYKSIVDTITKRGE